MTVWNEHWTGPPRKGYLPGLLALVWVMCLGSQASAEWITLQAAHDATLIEDPAGAFANGSGPAFFVGRTAESTDSRRRSLLLFDVAAVLPPAATIERVELSLVLTPSNRAVTDVVIHRVFSPWSEGPSSASGGGGARSVPGDSTWVHTSYDTHYWNAPGGDFEPSPSAYAVVGEAGIYVWESTTALVADVQGWLDEPTSNRGWLLVGDETAPSTSKRFASRESPDEAARPQLLVEYRIGCDHAQLSPGALGLCRTYCSTLDCDGPNPRGSARTCERLARNFARLSNGASPPCDSAQARSYGGR